MISMEGVPSSLILRNESWVRKQANSLARRLPSNVERADLIQVGLIAVAQAALGFEWPGDRESTEAREAFVLSQLEGLGYAEIAARLQVSERTVKRYMAQGFEQCLALVA